MKYVYIILISLFLFGCSTKIEYRDVIIPVKCEVDIPPAPTTTVYDAEYLKEVLIYTELLKSRLEFCVNGTKEVK